jgi:ribonuclease PH
MAGRGRGWLTAEYAMMPASSSRRVARERSGNVKGRTQEIQRLIGRCLRAAVDLEALGERTLHIDCDVLEADGGTRTASITGAWVALALALRRIPNLSVPVEKVLHRQIAAVSVGIVDGEVLSDLEYTEDSKAEVDMNIVMDGSGAYIEVQGTAEGAPFERSALDAMLDVGAGSVRELLELQRVAVESGSNTP